MNRLQLEYVLRVARISVVFYWVWVFFWAIYYETVVWKKQFVFFRNLDLWVGFAISVMLFAGVNLILKHPELELFVRKPKSKRKKQKKTKKKKKKSSRLPLY